MLLASRVHIDLYFCSFLELFLSVLPRTVSPFRSWTHFLIVRYGDESVVNSETLLGGGFFIREQLHEIERGDIEA